MLLTFFKNMNIIRGWFGLGVKSGFGLLWFGGKVRVKVRVGFGLDAWLGFGCRAR